MNNHARGSTHSNAKLTAPEVLKIREIYASRKSTIENLAKMFGCSVANINSIVYGRSWKHLL